MGTKVDSKSYLPGYYPMRDLNEDSSSSSWPLCYGDKATPNGQYYNGFMRRTAMDGYPGYGMDALKQKILEHEAVFKSQVYELHRLYRIQRDMMEEIRRKEQHKTRASMEPSSSSSRRGPQVPLEEARKWHLAGLPLLNSTYERTSISGVEIANSPMSCTKGNSTQPVHFPLQNGSSVKDIELLDSRPLKVRKKLFDLELPADEYIDTEEGQRSPECKVSHVSSYAPNGNLKSEPENQKSSPVEHTGGTTDCRINVSTSASCLSLRNSTWLADLNEPIDIEEATAPSSTDFLGHSSINGQTNGVNYGAKSNAAFLGVNAKTAHYRDGVLINSSVESKVIERGPLSHNYEPGSSKSNLDSATRGLQDNSHPMQCMPNPLVHPSGMYPSRRSGEDIWREENHHHLESSNRNRDQSNNRFLGPHIASRAPGSDSFFSSPYFSGTWAHAVPSWAKPSFTQKITPVDSCLNPASRMDRGLQISAGCLESNGGKWRVGDDFRLNPGFGGDQSARNGFYHGSASGSKELKAQLPSAGFDYLNCSRGDNQAYDHMTNHGFGRFPKGSSFADSKPATDINLNDVVSKSSSNEVVILQDAATVVEKGKPANHLSMLPWLRNKPANANGAVNPSSYLQASSSQFSCKTEAVRDLNEPFIPKAMPASSDRKAEITRNQNVKKILGFPIFETGGSRNEPLSHVSTSASFSCPPDRNNVDKKRKNVVIDINLECEPEEPIASEEQDVEKEKQERSGFVRDLIDLNSCVTDCGDTLAPSYENKTPNVKVILEIDLESPLLPEEEEYGNTNTPSNENTAAAVVTDSSQEEALRIAAEVILAMSSSSPKAHILDSNIDLLEASLEESFLWFVNAVSPCPNELKTASISEELSEEMDDFEARTLQIPETKEEDYMPTPFVPDADIAEDGGGNTLTRPRRGQSRRGRQRRDFQRDILPGLTSLSRHEVTEDIQVFGGLMRATGHHWLSGLARRNATRNGGGRGRRRAMVVESVTTVTPSPSPVCTTPLMQQLSNIEAGLEDRSLTGWGKTPRRPRRQRCPAGNTAAVVLT